MRWYIFFFLMVSGYFSCFGQIFKTEMDTTYIRLYPNTIKVKAIFLDRYFDFRLKEKGYDPVVKLAARELSHFGIGLTVWNLNLDLASLIPNPLEKKQLGEEEGFDLQLSLYTRRWNFDAAVERIRNFTLKNAEILENFEDERSTLNSLDVRRVIVGSTYIFNPEKFSFRSSFIQVDRQLKSAGSPVLSFDYTYLSIESDSLFTPSSISEGTLEPVATKVHKFALQPGYSYNFIYKAWYVNTTVAGGFDVQRMWYDIDNLPDTQIKVQPQFDLQGGIGYNSDTFSAGFLIFYQLGRTRLSDLIMKINRGSIRIFAAYRFPSPKFVRKVKPKFLD